MKYATSAALIWLTTTSVLAAPITTPVPPEGGGEREEYAIDEQASVVNILVYSDGALARLGHNHVMTSRSVQGRAWMAEESKQLGFELAFRPDELIVDDPEQRAAAGDNFPLTLTHADREGTRRNMLGASVLDAEHFPLVAIRSVRMSGTLPEPQFTVLVTLKGVSREVSVSPRVTVTQSQLIAIGDLDIRQSDFGIKPFTVALGALRVEDRLRINFVLSAKLQSKP